MRIKNVEINIEKMVTEKKYLLLSDLHVETKESRNINDMCESIKTIDHDSVLIPGDILNRVGVLDNAEVLNRLFKLFDILGKNHKVVCSLGNHDLMDRVGRDWQKADKNRLIDFLRNNTNAIVLDNQRCNLDGVTIDGFTLPYEYYKNEAGTETISQFLEAYRNFKLEDVDTPKLLMVHSAYNAIETGLPDNYDVIVSGHSHNGLVPPALDFIPGSIGLMSPQTELKKLKGLFPKYTRGLIEGKYIINGAINPFNEYESLDRLYGPTGTVLTLKPNK